MNDLCGICKKEIKPGDLRKNCFLANYHHVCWYDGHVVAWTKEKAIDYLCSIGMTPEQYKILFYAYEKKGGE